MCVRVCVCVCVCVMYMWYQHDAVSSTALPRERGQFD